MAYPFAAKTVRYSKIFDEQREAIDPDAARMDDVLRGVEWAIATKPSECAVIPGTEIHVIKTNPFPGAPAMRLYFTVSDAHCNVLEIHLIEQNEEED